jgi:hypothetical protein
METNFLKKTHGYVSIIGQSIAPSEQLLILFPSVLVARSRACFGVVSKSEQFLVLFDWRACTEAGNRPLRCFFIFSVEHEYVITFSWI